MTRKRLYTLTDEQVYIIAHALNVAEDHASITRETKDMMRGTALIPLDIGDAKERITRAIYAKSWGRRNGSDFDMAPYREDADAALDALLQEEEA